MAAEPSQVAHDESHSKFKPELVSTVPEESQIENSSDESDTSDRDEVSSRRSTRETAHSTHSIHSVKSVKSIKLAERISKASSASLDSQPEEEHAVPEQLQDEKVTPVVLDIEPSRTQPGRPENVDTQPVDSLSTVGSQSIGPPLERSSVALESESELDSVPGSEREEDEPEEAISSARSSIQVSTERVSKQMSRAIQDGSSPEHHSDTEGLENVVLGRLSQNTSAQALDEISESPETAIDPDTVTSRPLSTRLLNTEEEAPSPTGESITADSISVRKSSASTTQADAQTDSPTQKVDSLPEQDGETKLLATRNYSHNIRPPSQRVSQSLDEDLYQAASAVPETERESANLGLAEVAGGEPEELKELSADDSTIASEAVWSKPMPGGSTPTMQHDSMVTVRLSESTNPPALTLDTGITEDINVSVTALDQSGRQLDDDSSDAATSVKRDSTATLSPTKTPSTLQAKLQYSRRSSRSSDSDEEVDWAQLEKTEDEQVKDEDSDKSTALLLARLDEENAKLATNPKSVKVTSVELGSAKRPRPPSMAQLRQLVHGPRPSSLRYSLVPPPPMTDLEFYAALVKDYQQTASRLPTLLSNKIRKGIPPPLRGVVWQSISGARDSVLEEQYEKMSGESSPYEPIIVKDLGRSFPGVDMFREPEGDGQRMLGRVLKSFSLYDTKIGYCQGLAFLVGPLLMHMPDKQAFCVLVRLMERYDLRTCFLPDLSGLHVRIYQFRELLKMNLPTLSGHLEELQVDPAYVSQWFLSFFAVTCPLPMLFRIYDVVFAEGATETLMRVALSLMRKNESRLLACTELEDAMSLLLSRGLWDCYGYNADEFVDDFVSLSSEVSKEKLTHLERGYKESLVAAANAFRTSDITTAATRFLGRIWASSAMISPKSATPVTLSPSLPPPSVRHSSTIRRSASKQSLASTLNSVEATSASITSSTSTDATNVSRNSGAEAESTTRESTPIGNKSVASIRMTEDRHLHSQIEDLLTALSELQRNHALLSNQLQREKEEREEDKKAVRSLLDGLRKKTGVPPTTPQVTSAVIGDDDGDDNKRRSTDTQVLAANKPSSSDTPSTEDLTELLGRVEGRFSLDEKDARRSSTMQTKAQLREELANARAQLISSSSQSQDIGRRLEEAETEMRSLKEQLKESHSHFKLLHSDKQRLEKQMHGLKSRSSVYSAIESSQRELEPEWASKPAASGLRELKLGRTRSTPSQAGATFNKRLSSLPGNQPAVADSASSSNDQESLLLELVQAKTAEATAKQEAEEARQRLEAFRKAYGIAPGDTPGIVAATATAAEGMFSMLGRLTGQGAATTTAPSVSTPAVEPVTTVETLKNETPSPSATTTTTTTTTASSGGGFWGWRR